MVFKKCLLNIERRKSKSKSKRLNKKGNSLNNRDYLKDSKKRKGDNILKCKNKDYSNINNKG
jgi:hypothetical protein